MGFSEWKNERGVKMYKKNNKKEKTKDSYRHLSPLEKETIIVFNKGEKEASIFTYEKTWQKHLETRFNIKPELVNNYGGKSYIINKDRIMKPRAPFSKKKKVTRKDIIKKNKESA